MKRQFVSIIRSFVNIVFYICLKFASISVKYQSDWGDTFAETADPFQNEHNSSYT